MRPRDITRLALGAVVAIALAPHSRGATASIPAARDNTLIEHPAGLLSNGAGPHFFAGRTGGSAGSIRRAVIAFDLSAIPPGSTIRSAALTLSMDQTNAGPVTIALHRLASDWGEGTSIASGGGGAPSTIGDATWIHTFYDSAYWSLPGGDFDPSPSGTAIVDEPGFYTWSSPEMAADVQRWLDDPSGSFGWILIGDETAPQTAKRFDSREETDGSTHPRLAVDFEEACSPSPRGPGYWRRQCLGLSPQAGGLAPPGGGSGPDSTLEPGFEDVALPCAEGLASELAIGSSACGTLDPRAHSGRARVVFNWLGAVAFNVCSGRLSLDCPVDRSGSACAGETLGDRLQIVASLLRAGDFGGARACLAPLPGPGGRDP